MTDLSDSSDYTDRDNKKKAEKAEAKEKSEKDLKDNEHIRGEDEESRQVGLSQEDSEKEQVKGRKSRNLCKRDPEQSEFFIVVINLI